MRKGGICIQHTDLKFCMLHDKVFGYQSVKFVIFAGRVWLSQVSKFPKMWYQINRWAEIWIVRM